MKKVSKGAYGYLARRRKTETIKTILYFLIPLALFAAGILTTGTRRNLLTIVAVLGILPASKNAVLLIMYLKSHGISAADHTIITSTINKDETGVKDALILLEDMVFTTREVTYEVPAIILYGGSMLGYLSPQQQKKVKEQQAAGKGDMQKLLQDLEKHLETTMKKENLSVNAKIYEGIEPFTKRILEIKPLEHADRSKSEAAARVLADISL